MTYLWLNAGFLLIAGAFLAGALLIRREATVTRRWWLPVCLAGLVVMILTAVFDTLMISVGLMTYAPEQICGLRVGLAPIEDFAYPVAGLIILPSLWLLYRKRGTRDR